MAACMCRQSGTQTILFTKSPGNQSHNQDASAALQALSTQTPVRQPSPSQTQKPPLPARKTRSPFSFYVPVSIGVAILLVSLLLFFIYTTQRKNEAVRTLDGYLTAVENREWQVAYDYLCPEIQAKIPTADDMARRMFEEMSTSSLPSSHDIQDVSDAPDRVEFMLSGPNWYGGPYEARVVDIEGTGWKICGLGKSHGDLRYLLRTGAPPLDIAP